MAGIHLANYPVLATYSVLGNDQVWSPNGATTVLNGFYGSVAGVTTGTVIGTLNNTNATVANAQLMTLINDLNTYVGTLPTQGFPAPSGGGYYFTT